MNLSGLGYLRLLVVLMFLACAVMAQTNDKGDDPQKQDQSDPQKQNQSGPQNSNPQKNYDPANINPITGISYVSQNNYTPLTGKERFHLYLKQTFMPPSAYLGSLFNAAVDVIHHDPPEWRLGAAGYGRRLALRLGNNLVQNSFMSVEAAALHEEPRYIVSQKKGFLHRMGHAFLYTFVTYNNSGKLTPNIAFVTSTYAGTMITTYGLPKRYTPLGDGVRDGNMQIAFTSLYNVVEEFWPDIMKMFKH